MKKFIKKITKNDLIFSFIITSIIFVCVLFLLLAAKEALLFDSSEIQSEQKCYCECTIK